MANIVVTSSTNYIKVEFNDYYPDYYKVCEAYYNRNDLEKNRGARRVFKSSRIR